MYVCCNNAELGWDGVLAPRGSEPPWNMKTFASLPMYGTIMLKGNCSASGTPSGCWSVGASCRAALARKEAFTQEVLSFIKTWQLAGVHMDWENGYDNDIPCHQQLWGAVSVPVRAAGKQLAFSIDDSQGNAFDPAATDWSFEWDWKYFIPYADVLANMGTYPGSWSKGISYPAKDHLEAYPCPHASGRWCGIKGQLKDMVQQGVNASSLQLQMGIRVDACLPGGVTASGWTQAALKSFLEYADEEGVQVIAVWTEDAMILKPETTFTCPWFIAELRRWALG